MKKMFFQARSTIRDLDPTNDITFLRLRSKKNEVLIAPGNNMYLVFVNLFSTWSHQFQIPNNEKWYLIRSAMVKLLSNPLDSEKTKLLKTKTAEFSINNKRF
jgi:hypothetical protein